MTSIALWSAAALTLAVLCLWLLSLKLKDASIADIFWGLGFVIVGGIGFALGDGDPARKLLMLALVALWGLRLAGYLAWRNRGKGEDKRYAAMREDHGDRWWWVSLFQVFLLQGALIVIVSLPLQAAASYSGPLGWLDALGVALFAVGLFFEAVGDYQLARFKAAPAHRGLVMDRGLWHYTRHPNYFGDFCIWWGFYAIAASAGAAWTVLSPLVMSVLLLKVSGVAMLESVMGDRPGYAEYVRKTSAFFPRPPRT